MFQLSRSQFPRGVPGLGHSMREKVGQGNSHSDWLADLVKLAEQYIAFFGGLKIS